MSGVDVAWVDLGRLLVRSAGAEAALVESRFGASVLDRLVQIEQRHAWKTQGRGAQFMRGGLLWGGNGKDLDQVAVAIAAVSRGTRPGEVLYALRADDVHGLFAWGGGEGGERRLFHGTKFRFHDVSADAEHPRIACTIQYGATSNLAVLDADGSALTEVTEGDSMDMAPCWAPGERDVLVYQSAGVARDGEGVPVGLGPAAIMRLDLASGRVTPVLEIAGHDLLSPRVAKDGGLWYIRRPWRSPGERPWTACLDALLVPWRLLVAVYAFLDAFTRSHTGKPLTTAGGPRREGAEARHLMIMGNLIDAEKVERESRRLGEERLGLVPSTWHLVCRGRDGSERLVEKGIVSFDLAADGTPVVSNGRLVYRRDAAGRREILGSGERILHVAAL